MPILLLFGVKSKSLDYPYHSCCRCGCLIIKLEHDVLPSYCLVVSCFYNTIALYIKTIKVRSKRMPSSVVVIVPLEKNILSNQTYSKISRDLSLQGK